MPSAIEILTNRLQSSREESPRAEQSSVTQTDATRSALDALREVGGYGLGAVSAVGNVLDLPGSMVRDAVSSILTGKFVNPVDQLLTPFSGENRTSGRKLLEDFGFRKNRDSTLTDWVKDPYEGALDIGGFLVEVVLDPTAPMKWTLGGVTGLDKTISAGARTGARRAGRAARKAVGKIPGYGEPILDLADRSAAWATSLFNSKQLGVTDPRHRELAEELEKGLRVGEDTVRTSVGTAITIADREGLQVASDSPESLLTNIAIRQYWEGIDDEFKLPNEVDAIPDAMKPVLDKMVELKDRVRASEIANGGNRVDLVDDYANHAFRQMGDEMRLAIAEDEAAGFVPRAVRGLSTNGGSLNARNLLLKGYKRGTAGVQELFTDERNQEIVSEISKYFDDHLDTSSIIGAAANHAGPRHLRKLARRMGTTERELWKEIGFTLEKPYATAADFNRALTQYKNNLSQQARKGIGDVRQKTGFGGAKVFKNLITGDNVQVKFSPEGVPLNLPNGQKAYDVFSLKATDRVSDEVVQARIDGFRSGLSSDPDALARFEEVLEAAGNTDQVQLLRWADKDGNAQFFFPVLQHPIEVGWKRRVGAISKRIANQPVREVEAAQEALRVHFEKNYSDLVDDAMPVVNSEGKFIYELIDEQGNRVGKPIALQAKQALLADENLDEFFARRIQLTEGAVSARARTTSRFQGLGYMAARSADIRRVGLFTNSPFIDFQDGMFHAIRRTEVLKAMRALTVDAVEGAIKSDVFGGIQRVPVEGGAIGTGTTLKKLLTAERGIDSARFKDLVRTEVTRKGLWKRNDKAGIKMFNEMLDDLQLNEDTWRELNDWLSYHETPRAESMFGRAVDAAMSVFKSGLLSTPRTVARDALSATTMSFIMQDLSLNPSGFRSLSDGFALARGKAAKDGLDLPAIRELAENLGLDPNSADDRQRAFTNAYAAMANQVAGVHAQLNSDELTKIASGQADAYLKARPMGMIDSLTRVFGENVARDPVTGQVQTLNTLNNFLNPMKMMQVPGAMRWDESSKTWVVNSKANWVADLHGTVRGTMDNAVRMGSILHRMRTRGETMRQAFETVATHQVNYDPRRFTKFERKWMKRLFPFYSFISRMVPLVATELATSPGGPLGQVIRAQRVMQGDEDAYVPYDLQDTAAIPWGQNAEGDLRYVTNLGLMHEDALRFIAPVDGVRGLLQKVLGSMNPAAKFAVEYGTNTSTFFDGPMGGRRLDDLDPLLGRILVNMGVRDLPPSGRPEPLGNAFTEALVANSPVSAALQYIRTVSESSDRRSAAEKALNLVTGVRTRLITPEMLTRELRDRLNAEQIALGARPLTTVLGASDLADRYEEIGGEEEAARLRIIEAALRDIRKAAKDRSKQKD